MTDALTVHLGVRSYDIRFGTDLGKQVRAQVDALLGSDRKIVVVTDANVRARQAAALEAMAGGASVMTLPAGEETKSLSMLGRVWDKLAEQGLDRSGAVLAVGGGVIGDLAGYAAAAYLRGIDYYQVPTTLLAMVDSSVGGKTGINLAAGKNLVGSFHQPRAVFVATDFLATLPPRDFAAGMAEVIKYGLLGDAALLTRLEEASLTVRSEDLAAVIRRCCEIKARIVEADEREQAADGGRALLNLGHTFGHAIEQATAYGAYRHGEAVAIGLSAAARLSQRLGHLSAADVARVDAVVASHGLPVRLAAPLPLPVLFDAMGRDKKVRAGLPRFVVLRRLGDAAIRAGVDRTEVEAVWREIGAR